MSPAAESARVISVVTEPDRAVAAAAAALTAGDVIALATDTVYGLAAMVDDEVAIERIFELKRRPTHQTMAVLVADSAQAATLVEMTPAAVAVAEEFWPGSLTIVAPRARATPAAVGTEHTIGVREPDEPFVTALAARVGPLAATSANIHGEDTPTTAVGVAQIFPDLPVVIDGGERTGGASTVVRVTGGGVEIIRAGPVTGADVQAVVDRVR